MDTDLSKYGISIEDLEIAALSDLDNQPAKVNKEVFDLPRPSAVNPEPVRKPITDFYSDTSFTPVHSEPELKRPDSVKSFYSDSPDTLPNKPIPIPEPVYQETDNKSQNHSVAGEKSFKEKFMSLYLVDFFRRLFTKDNSSAAVWMCINFVLTLGVLFIPSVAIALSPIGEWYLRYTNNCHKLDKKYISKKKTYKYQQISKRLTPLFEEVYEKARAKNPDISQKIELFYTHDNCPNAFATGRKTICVTSGLMLLSDEEIKGVLAHEFGHLSNKDTDLTLACLVGNLPVVLFITVCQIILNLIFIPAYMVIDEGDHGIVAVLQLLLNIPLKVFKWLWNKIGTLCLRASMRKHEFKADDFAVDLGYYEELSETLAKIDDTDYDEPKGLMAALMATHPDTPDRLISMKEHYEQNNISALGSGIQ